MSTNFFLKQTCENVSTRWDGKAANIKQIVKQDTLSLEQIKSRLSNHETKY